ncbi:unnamed protein product [Phytophthora fragariaefolia]|uniref:Unnamed protein product n=1 Tax=Phytophthora fragariaefolia TaxID=1490495 RepID=A0A9W6TS67_9STRA|nr:unnamed protein product [Phytophthora fragariaefolia]
MISLDLAREGHVGTSSCLQFGSMGHEHWRRCGRVARDEFHIQRWSASLHSRRTGDPPRRRIDSHLWGRHSGSPRIGSPSQPPPIVIHLRPGESANVNIRYGQSNPKPDVVWTGRGDRWVTQILYGPQTWATAVKVVSISNQDIWIDTRTPVGRIVAYGHFPTAGRFVCPGLRCYQEWQQLIFESTLSVQARLRAERYEQMLRDNEPPAVQTRDYQWSTKLLMRPRTDVSVSSSLENGSGSGGVESPQQHDPTSKRTSDEDQVSEGTEAVEGTPRDEPAQEGEDSEMPTVIATGTPVEKLELEYARCMRVNSEELDLEPAVFMKEANSCAQLKDELALLPELLDLSPKCDIIKADVGEPGLSTDV